ncbi:MAG: transcriptional regulator [Bacteroidota bacterium]
MKKTVLNREENPVEELQRHVSKEYNNISLSYDEVYYLDYEVDENTGMINKDKLVPHYTKDQVARNLKSLKSAYLIAKGAASPNEIIDFRKKYQMPASILSIILGFSKNTISNIENEGVTSLPSGRLIKLCLSDKATLSYYIEICPAIEQSRKNEFIKRLAIN